MHITQRTINGLEEMFIENVLALREKKAMKKLLLILGISVIFGCGVKNAPVPPGSPSAEEASGSVKDQKAETQREAPSDSKKKTK